MNSEKFLITQDGKSPQRTEGGAQKCGQDRGWQELWQEYPGSRFEVT